MWTRKAAIMLTSGLSLILIGMMIANFQLMIVGLTFMAFLAINGWVEGHSELDVSREISAVNEGTATITGTTEDGSFNDTIIVTVDPEPVVAIGNCSFEEQNGLFKMSTLKC